ncbi:D-xylose transport system permease protein [Haloactinopolyspora alba]|uniref:D-xylose transport system permease protein n=1 Tax=Haloactinopolyspora alba TaxID=648780 RepID=A0A2P8EFH9_9ACTN|nr:ABC transporter permease [Haloactinopolyspora alba]PSL08225.1 D-xylose transport system permease protein [Haloactinopolyspora alba]
MTTTAPRPAETIASRPAPSMRQRLEPFRLQRAGVVYAFALILLTFTLASEFTGRPFYLSPVNSANILDQTVQVGILAIVMTICLISGNFDLSVGATAALGAGVTLTVLNTGAGVTVAVLAGLGSGVLMGLINGALVQGIGLNAFIVTLGTMTGVRGLLFILTDGQSIQTERADLGELFGGVVPINAKVWAAIAGLAVLALGVVSLRRERMGQVSSGYGPWLIGSGALLAVFSLVFFPTRWELTTQVYIFAAIAVIAWLVLRFTAVGRRLYAVGGNTESARLSGIPVARYKITPFVLNGFCAALVGILYVSRFSAINPQAMTGLELTVIAAAILGGTSLFGGAGNVLKSVVGALILFTLINGFGVMNLGANYQDLIKGVVIIGAATVYVLAERRGTRRRPKAATP